MIEQKQAMIPILNNLARLTGKHPQAVAGCFAALVNLAGARPSFKNALVQGTDAIAATKLALVAHASDATCQLYGMWLLANLSLNDMEGSRKVLEDDGLDTVLAIMRGNAGQAGTLRLCAALLGQFARTDAAELGPQIAAKGGVELITEALKAHPGDAKLATTGAQALQNLLHSGFVNAQVLAAGSIDAVLAVMRAHPADVNVQQAGIGTLINSLALKRLEVSGCEVIVAALKDHLRVDTIQSGGCMLLGCAVELVYDGGKGLTELVEYLKQLATLGAVVHVVNAINAHLGSAEVCRAACSALQNLAIAGINNDGVRAAGGVRAVVTALGKHVSNPAAINATFAVLNNCLRDAESLVEAANAGAVPAILKVLEANPANPDLQKRGIALLGQLGLASDVIRDQVAKEGVAQITAAMRSMAANPAVVATAIGALRNITYAGQNVAEVLAAGAVPLVIDAMMRFPKNVDIQHAACGLMVNMCLENEEAREAFARAGAGDVIDAALANHKDSAGLQRSGNIARGVIAQTLDLLKAQHEAQERARAQEAADAERAAQLARDGDAAAAQRALEENLEAKAKMARTQRTGGRVQELIDLYESGELYHWEAPKKIISLKH